MARNLSLSQAARLIGVTRKEIQEKIRQNKLTVMEGTVQLDDLKNAYPEAEYEDNTMLEKTQQLMADAVHKMAQSELEGAQLNALSRRAHHLNQELAQQKARADYYEQLLNQLRRKFVDLSTTDMDISAVISIQQWLNEKMDNPDTTSDYTEQLSEQIEQFMQPHVRLLPSRHDFISDKSQTILESALASGLAVDYGCNNGRCGKCKVKLVSGQVKACKHSDYIFSQSEKDDNSILTCVNQAVSDIVLETHEAVTEDEIPLQKIPCKIKKLNLVNAETYVLDLKTPRSQRLRFLAGQTMQLNCISADDEILTSAPLNIASCPCDDRNIQFHFSANSSSPFFQQLIARANQTKEIILEGPDGHFILDENSPRSIILVAEGEGFAAIKSLAEHALALDLDRQIHLIWIAKSKKGHYMDNLCRAWNDALDNFYYQPTIIDNNNLTEHSIQEILFAEKLNARLGDSDFYISVNEILGEEIKNVLLSKGCGEEQLHINKTANI